MLSFRRCVAIVGALSGTAFPLACGGSTPSPPGGAGGGGGSVIAGGGGGSVSGVGGGGGSEPDAGGFGVRCTPNSGCADPIYNSCELIQTETYGCTKLCHQDSDCPNPPTSGHCVVQGGGYCI
jgi:hypothetical protein